MGWYNRPEQKKSVILVFNPRNMIGIGTTKVTKEIRTITNSSANIFPKSQKLRDKGFVKSYMMLIGKRIRIGWIYLLK